MNKCFCHFNGYEVKDAKARKDIENLSNYVTPKMYGAIGDGVANDTQAFQNAIATGKDIFIPEGTYLLDSITLNQNILIKGMGEKSILKMNGTFIISGCRPLITEVCFKANAELENLVLLSNVIDVVLMKNFYYNLDNLCNCAIKLDATTKAYYCQISNSRFNDFEIGVNLYHNANSNTIKENEFYLCGTCVKIDGCNGVRVENNGFQSFYKSGVKLEYNNYGSITKCNLIQGNYFEGTTDENMKSNLIGDIDCSNQENINHNYFIFNNNTYNSNHPTKVVNEIGKNYKFLYDGSTFNAVNNVPGFTKINNVATVDDIQGFKSLINGTIVNTLDENNKSQSYLVSENKVLLIPTYKDSTDTEINYKNIICTKIAQFYGGGIQFGYSASPSKTDNYFTCFDSSKKRLVSAVDQTLRYYQTIDSGTTENRPTPTLIGQQYYDTTLGKPIWWSGSNWKDATGTNV